MENRRRVGTFYEKQAAEYLKGLGYKILEQNFRCRLGEIDLIAEDGNVLVFLEVKYRRNARYGAPAEAVTLSKQKTICQTADYYRMSQKVPENRSCRFDVIAIEGTQTKIYKNAFPYRGRG